MKEEVKVLLNKSKQMFCHECVDRGIEEFFKAIDHFFPRDGKDVWIEKVELFWLVGFEKLMQVLPIKYSHWSCMIIKQVISSSEAQKKVQRKFLNFFARQYDLKWKYGTEREDPTIFELDEEDKNFYNKLKAAIKYGTDEKHD